MAPRASDTPAKKGEGAASLGPLPFAHPLLESLNLVARELAGLNLMVLYPSANGWNQCGTGSAPDRRPDFCRLIQGSAEGVKRCRTCHLLMSVAACTGAPSERVCHAGASVLVAPATTHPDETMAVLSSCVYAGKQDGPEVREQALTLGIALGSLRQAYRKLPKLTASELRCLAALVKTAAEAVKILHEAARTATLHGRDQTGLDGVQSISQALQQAVPPVPPDTPPHGKATAPRGSHPLIQVLERLISQRPDLPLTVKAVAGAARLTPNHVSLLFHQQTGQTFSDYLLSQRLVATKKLLRNLTLSVREVAQRAGFSSARYFARRFRQKTGLSPRAWRKQNLRT